MWGIRSDILSNLEGLQAVRADVDAQAPVERVLCLGDTVGYGPNPLECLDLVRRRCDVALLGNHDQAVLFDPENFGAAAAEAIVPTRQMLEKPDPDSKARWVFLSQLPATRPEGHLLFVHRPGRDPVLPDAFPQA